MKQLLWRKKKKKKRVFNKLTNIQNNNKNEFRCRRNYNTVQPPLHKNC